MRLRFAFLILAMALGLGTLEGQQPSPTAAPDAVPQGVEVGPPAELPSSSPAPPPADDGGPRQPNGDDGGPAREFRWGRDVLAPLVRLAGIAGILFLVVWGLNLDKVFKPEVWTERTIMALAIVLTFCALLLLGGVDEKVLGIAKDIALIVIGFYFGASKGGPEGRPPGAAARDEESSEPISSPGKNEGVTP